MRTVAVDAVVVRICAPADHPILCTVPRDDLPQEPGAVVASCQAPQGNMLLIAPQVSLFPKYTRPAAARTPVLQPASLG